MPTGDGGLVSTSVFCRSSCWLLQMASSLRLSFRWSPSAEAGSHSSPRRDVSIQRHLSGAKHCQGDYRKQCHDRKRGVWRTLDVEKHQNPVS